MHNVHLGLSAATSLATNCLMANGCDQENARAVADNMVQVERDGCAAHGLFRLPWHVTSLRSGKVNGSARPYVQHIASAVVKVSGDRGFAPSSLAIGIPALMPAAKEFGIAALAI